jgi:hypothetical protein
MTGRTNGPSQTPHDDGPSEAGVKRIGRPVLLTEEVRATIVGCVASGALFKDAVAAAGVAESTAYEWLARGEGRDPDRPPTPDMEVFAREVRQSAAMPMLTAAVWLFTNRPDVWLARRDPVRWGPNGHATHGVPGDEGDAREGAS